MKPPDPDDKGDDINGSNLAQNAVEIALNQPGSEIHEPAGSALKNNYLAS